jgi:hypothetical protein
VINFEEELKKFKPSLEIDETEDMIATYDTKDIADILNEMIKEMKNSEK